MRLFGSSATLDYSHCCSQVKLAWLGGTFVVRGAISVSEQPSVLVTLREEKGLSSP